MSEREAAGKLANIPGMVEAEATNPIQKPSGVSRFVAKGFKTGFLDSVELKMARDPIIQSIQKMLYLAFFRCKTINKINSNILSDSLDSIKIGK